MSGVIDLTGDPPAAPPPAPLVAETMTPAQRTTICRAYFADEGRSVEREHQRRYELKTLARKYFPADTPANAQVRRALMEQLAQPAPWSSAAAPISNDAIVAFLNICWIKAWELPDINPPINEHTEMGNQRFYQWHRSGTSIQQGLSNLLAIILVKGPTFDPRKVGRAYTNALIPNITMSDNSRYCLLLPFIQNLWMNGDPLGSLPCSRYPDCNKNMESKNMKSWLSDMFKYATLGVFTKDFLSERCKPGHPDYPLACNTTQAKKWTEGLQYEVAIILRCVVPNFPKPTNDNTYFCNAQEKEDYNNKILRAPDGTIVTRPFAV